MKNFMTLFILFFTFFIFYKKECNEICWSENVILEWGDFKGSPSFSSNKIEYLANTYCAISCVPYQDDNLPNFRVKNVFNKSLSWSLDTSSSLLNHERLHFDISELVARKIRKAIDNLRNEKESNIEVYNSLIKVYFDSLKYYNRQYDAYTGNGSIDFLQEEWDQKIQLELNRLSKYSSKIDDCEQINLID